MFRTFHAAGEHHRHDTVIVEATRVLEDRMRALTHSTDGASGSELAVRAFGGKAPCLSLSSVASEQEAVLALFRGTFGFIRNPVHHRLSPDFVPERVVQILGLIDCLLGLLRTATPASPTSTARGS